MIPDGTQDGILETCSRADPCAVAQAVHSRAIVSARITARTPIVYDPYLAGRLVERVTGIAETVDGDTVPWGAIVKRTTGVGLRAARRELAAYREGIAGPASANGLRAPSLLGCNASKEHVELWLEVLADEYGGRWPTARFGLAARHIAAWDAATSKAPPIPGFDSEDAWAERHGQPHRLSQAVGELHDYRTGAAAELMRLLDDPGFRRAQALITSTPTRIDRLAAFPQTFLHHDLVRSNLFALTASTTAAIDWENVGRGPLGVNLAPLVVGSVRRGEASADDLLALEHVVLSGYEDGLRHAGIDDVDSVRTAYRLALGLRWHTVLGTISAWLDPTTIRIRGSLPGEPRAESLRHLVVLSRHLLAAGEDAC
jgi:hypothetical protein